MHDQTTPRKQPVHGHLATWALAFSLAWPLAAGAQTAPQVPVTAVQVRGVGAGFELDGAVQPVKQSTLSAQAQGRVARLFVKAGDAVKAGQVLATIDDRDSQAGLERAQAGVAQAEAQLRNAEAQWKRTRELKNQGFVAQAALDTAEATYRSAEAGAREARASQTQSGLAQGYTRVTAPYNGYVLETLVEAGDLATPGKPLLTLYAPNPLRVVAYVPASRSGLAAKAQQIEVQLPGGRWIAPTASTRLPAADPVSQTVEWRLDLPAAATDLVPGQQARVRWVSGNEQRMVIPASALLRRGELTGVYVARENTSGAGFVLRAVRTGADHGAAGIEILAGLQAGEKVALDPVRAGLAQAQPAAQ